MKILFGLCCLLLVGVNGYAIGDESEEKTTGITPVGIVVYQGGQVNNPAYENDHLRWTQDVLGVLGFKVQLSPRFNSVIAVRGKQWLVFQNPNDFNDDFNFSEVYGSYAVGGTPESPWFNLIGGISNVKYNQDAKHLGEYLLSSGAYSPWLVNNFAFPMYKAMGARVSSRLLDGKIRQDLVLSSERNYQPHGDYSLSYVAGVALGDFIDVGAGISYSRLIPVSWEKLEENIKTRYARDDSGEVIIEDGDTLRYTPRGMKLVARASLDPKVLLPAIPFGPNDLKIYSEIALLGVKNYGTTYDKRSERMPVMFGMHIPTFNCLDIFSFEIEYYNSPYRLIPDINPDAKESVDAFVDRDNWRWALYAKKTLIPGWSVTGLIASDHFRYPYEDGGYFEERMLASTHWHWRFRVTYDLGNSGLSFQ
ncbi:MAG: hypothetical protein HQK83_07470 [Fibrobacteria bacterium]|nr:hypothetical protein [Fibrobacteria bacterium]